MSPTDHIQETSSSSTSVAKLPNEIIWNIASYLMSPPSNNYGGSSTTIDSFYKPQWATISSFVNCSKALRIMGFHNWFRSIRVYGEDDWNIYIRQFPFIFKHTSAVIWRCSEGDDIQITWGNLRRLEKLTSIRVILPIPTDTSNEFNFQSLADEYLEAVPQSISELEVFNSLYPGPETMRLVADAFPNLCILRLQQPSIWCSLCFTCSIPHFARPFLEHGITYTDKKGLPALYASRLAPLQKLHTVVFTVGVERGVRPFDAENAYGWSGECEMCMLMMDNDVIFREACLARKKNLDLVPPHLRRVEWHFKPMSTFDNIWESISQDLYG